jgi:hypothetical protein
MYSLSHSVDTQGPATITPTRPKRNIIGQVHVYKTQVNIHQLYATSLAKVSFDQSAPQPRGGWNADTHALINSDSAL